MGRDPLPGNRFTKEELKERGSHTPSTAGRRYNISLAIRACKNHVKSRPRARRFVGFIRGRREAHIYTVYVIRTSYGRPVFICQQYKSGDLVRLYKVPVSRRNNYCTSIFLTKFVIRHLICSRISSPQRMYI